MNYGMTNLDFYVGLTLVTLHFRHFSTSNGRVRCIILNTKTSSSAAKGLPIQEIAAKVGTPFYLYSYSTLVRHFNVFDQAFKDIPHLVCYSAKANSNIALLRLFVDLGAGIDVVSRGELYRALKGGADPKKIVFSGVGKRADEIEYALSAGILMFNVESLPELEALNEVARKVGKKAPISIRVNPDIDPKTHPYISTGLKKNKFGIDINEAITAYRMASQMPHLEIIGIDCHIGSQLTQVGPFVEALEKAEAIDRATEKRRHGDSVSRSRRRAWYYL